MENQMKFCGFSPFLRLGESGEKSSFACIQSEPLMDEAPMHRPWSQSTPVSPARTLPAAIAVQTSAVSRPILTKAEPGSTKRSAIRLKMQLWRLWYEIGIH